jgi:ATP-dependent DNA helicase DinG
MSLPLAVIRFKQGFGRLIRSKTDRGIVLVLDHRVATKPYGRAFLRSLPPATIIQDTTESVLEAFRGFHSSRLPG